MKTNIKQEVQDIRIDKLHVDRRVSPRLQRIPKEKQPFYGSAKRKHSSASKVEAHCRKRDDDDRKEQFHCVKDATCSNKAKVDIDVRIPPKQYVPKIGSEGHLSVQRVSPRFKDIPAGKRPYYGSVQRRKLRASRDDYYDRKTYDNNLRLDSFKDNIVEGKNKDGTTMTKNDSPQIQKMNLDGDFLAQVVKYFSLHKGMHYGSNQKKKPDAMNGDLCHRKHEDDDTSKQETEVGHSTEKCPLNLARTDVEGRGTEKDFTLGLGSMEHKSTAILDFEDKSYLEFISSEAFLANNMHPRSAASVRESLVEPVVLISTCKDSSNCSHNSNKNGAEAESKIVDVTLQNSQKMGLTGLPLERRVSPRLRNKPICKRPFYGSNQKRRSSFPKDKITIEKSRDDHLIQERLPNVDRKNIGDRDTVSLLDVKYENRGIMDLENGASLKSLDYKRVLAHQLCEKVDAKMKGTVRALDKHHPSIVQSLPHLRRSPLSLSFDLLSDGANNNGSSKSKGGALKDFSELPGLVCEDISYGKESMRIPATNLIDPPTAPADSGFKYITSAKVTENVVMPPSPRGCNCKGSCTNPKSCSCARLNGSDFPYVKKDGGRLIEPKDVVFECGPRCGCGPNCVNRISQRGLKYQLEVYRTMNKGWAVRSWDFIPSGAFICEYIGVIRKSSELDTVSENDFIFQIDCWQTMKEIGGRERRQGDVSIHARSLVDKVDEAECETEFCVDGAYYGNVTRFINHSCDPNLFVQCVLSSHLDIRLARIVLFAADDIPPMQELTYDYGYELDSVTGSDGQVKQWPCYCGTSECRGRLY